MHDLRTLTHLNRAVTGAEAREKLREKGLERLAEDSGDPIRWLSARERDEIIHARIKRGVTLHAGSAVK